MLLKQDGKDAFISMVLLRRRLNFVTDIAKRRKLRVQLEGMLPPRHILATRRKVNLPRLQLVS